MMQSNNGGFCESCGAQLEVGANFCQLCGMQITPQRKTDTAAASLEPMEGRLFKMYSVVNNFRYKDVHYDNLRINWFMVGREITPIPFEEAIENYAALNVAARVHPENFIKECFTREETETLTHYLRTIERINAHVEICPLPVSQNANGYRDYPPIPGTDFYTLYKRKRYNLPFNVEGIFNIRMADERVMGDDERVTVVSGINVKDIQEYIKKKEKEKKNF